MDMGDMHGSHGGMDMGGADLFQVTNRKIAILFWYFVAAVVTICVIRRCIDALLTIYACVYNQANHANNELTLCSKKRSASRTEVPSRPTNVVSQCYATIITISRELTYPRFRPFAGRLTRYFSILPLGQVLLLSAYWTMILIMLWSNVILTPSSDLYGYKWEAVGFRAAWVSVTQLPLIYCLGGKANIISLLTGISYERLNWLHRWIARTIFLTVIVHWSYFFREWWLADFVQDELEMMPMVKYGFGAWAVIGWSVLTGFGFFRTMSYEIWLLQHLGSIGVLLWLLYVHLPAYARYNIWLSIGFVAFDRGIRGAWSLARNLHVTGLWRKKENARAAIGFDAQVQNHGDGYMTLSIDNIDFSWRPGQHVFISMPSCGIFESHPFTISTNLNAATRSFQIYFKCHSGFTGRLRKQVEAGKLTSVRTFISGPWGNPPLNTIERCNSLVFVASSTGASFTVPLFEHAVREAKYVRRICFYWIVRHESQLKIFLSRISSALQVAQALGIEINCEIFLTSAIESAMPQIHVTDENHHLAHHTPSHSSVSKASSEDSILNAKHVAADSEIKEVSTTSSSSASQVDATDTPDTARISFNHGRPQSWDDLIHPTLTQAEGETVVVACGGGALMADIRNYVAWISDQRAVHKGTGAQGIHLYTETYGW